MSRSYYTGTDFRRASNIEELRRVAARSVPAFAFEYAEGGAEDEVALRRNRETLQSPPWTPRTLVGGGVPTLDKDILGKPSKMPVIIAPTGFNGLQHADGDICLARSAAAAGIPFTLSTASNCPVGRLTREVPGRNWVQLYPLKSNEVSLRLVERAHMRPLGIVQCVLRQHLVLACCPGRRQQCFTTGVAAHAVAVDGGAAP